MYFWQIDLVDLLYTEAPLLYLGAESYVNELCNVKTVTFEQFYHNWFSYWTLKSDSFSNNLVIPESLLMVLRLVLISYKIICLYSNDLLEKT